MKSINVPALLKGKKIGILCGGISAERSISLKTGDAIYKALKALGLKAVKIIVGKDIVRKIYGYKIDIAFVALHGEYGEDGTIQGLLELCGIPYTGSGVLASALSIDKVFTKKIYESNKLAVPAYEVLNKNSKSKTLRKLKFPVVVKPSRQGSSIGVSIAKNNRELKNSINNALKFGDEIIIEKYIKGRELSVGVLGSLRSHGSFNSFALPVIEIIPGRSGNFYDQKAKYDKGGSKHIIPAGISAELYRKACGLAVASHNAFGCSGVSRTDMILEASGRIYLLEINTIPGMTATSLVPEAAACIGISFKQLVIRILLSAYKK